MKSRPLPAYEKALHQLSVRLRSFGPRSARETEGDPGPRFYRILIAGSKYSIHDLSRATRPSGDNPELNKILRNDMQIRSFPGQMPDGAVGESVQRMMRLQSADQKICVYKQGNYIRSG